MASKGDAAPLTVEQRLERLEAETIPPNSLSLRHRVQALEAVNVPAVPNDLFERLEELEAGKRRLGDDVDALRGRMTELERGRRWATMKIDAHDKAFASLETKVATLDDFRVLLEGRVFELERFRGRFDEDLVALTRRIAAVERPEALAEAVEENIAKPFRLALAEEIERTDARIRDLERARDLVVFKLEELGAWTSPAEIERLEETLRNEAAELSGRANAVGDDGEAPFDRAAAEALYRVGSALTTAARALMKALKGRPPDADVRDPR